MKPKMRCFREIVPNINQVASHSSREALGSDMAETPKVTEEGSVCVKCTAPEIVFKWHVPVQFAHDLNQIRPVDVLVARAHGMLFEDLLAL